MLIVAVTASVIQYSIAWMFYYVRHLDLFEEKTGLENMTYSQVKKHLKKTNSPHITKKQLKGGSNLKVLREAGHFREEKPRIGDMLLGRVVVAVYKVVGEVLASKEKKKESESKQRYGDDLDTQSEYTDVSMEVESKPVRLRGKRGAKRSALGTEESDG
jgi:hypothetical protein